ncbi:hypothetical protein HAX54_021327 [Datura stramonium]|uniref:Uncharacterized protein n=1 Tax=Datura stramonium TaxID=4076 RepID=A0ABS8UUX4_DATST|nr:hypothetical protein [Datura stramonium]
MPHLQTIVKDLQNAGATQVPSSALGSLRHTCVRLAVHTFPSMVAVIQSHPSHDSACYQNGYEATVDNLGNLYAREDVREDQVAAMMEEMDRRKKMMPPMDIDLNILAAASDSPMADRSHPNDWCVRYNPFEGVVAGAVQDCELPRDEVLPTRDSTRHNDLYWVPPIYSYHEARTF